MADKTTYKFGMNTQTVNLLAKKCGSCGAWRPVTEFYLNRASRDGRMSCCKNCNAAKGKRRRALFQERSEFVPPAKKCCPSCNEIKSAKDFYPHRTLRDGLSWSCKVCAAAAKRERYASDPKFALKARQRERNKQRDGSYTEYQKQYRGISRIKKNIAFELCARLGVDLDKLAKERYCADVQSDDGKT